MAAPAWPLRDFYTEEGEHLLHDEADDSLYETTVEQGGVPRKVGFLKRADGTVVRQRAAAEATTDFYGTLDSYLKERRVALRSLFDTFDVDRNGYLDEGELANFLRHLYPNITDADVAYFATMLDPNGDGKVQYDEIIETLTASRDAGLKLQRAGAGTPNATLGKVASAIRARGIGSAQSLFSGASGNAANSNALLHPSQLMTFLRQLVPTLTKQELLDAMANVRAFDPTRSLASWRDLTIVTGVAKVERTQGAASVGRTSASSSGAKVATQAAPTSAMHAQHAPLGEIRAQGGRTLYLDIRTGRVFETPIEDAWPIAVGFVTDAARRSYTPGPTATALDVTNNDPTHDAPFSALSRHFLNAGAVDAALAKHGSGNALDARGLHMLLAEVQPGTPEHISRYAFDTLDIAGQGRVTKDKLSSAVTDAHRAEAACRARDRGPVAIELAKVAGAVARCGVTRLKGVLARHDTAHSGSLTLRGVIAMVRELYSAVTATELRYMLCALRSLDHISCNAENKYSLDDLRFVLRLYKAPAPLLTSSSTSASASAGALSPAVSTVTRLSDEAWNLQSIRTSTTGESYVWDRSTSRAYAVPREDPFPLFVGIYDYRSGRVESVQHHMRFMDMLDDYLRNTSTRLTTLFDEFSRGGNGGLDRTQMEAFLRRLVPSQHHLSAADVDYVCTLLDINEDGVVTLQELLDVAKQCRNIEDEVRAPNRGVAMAVLKPLADRIDQFAAAHGGSNAVQRVFSRYSAAGSLTHHQVLQAVKELAPGSIDSKPLRYVLAALHALAPPSGQYSAHDLREVLRLLRPSTADTGAQTAIVAPPAIPAAVAQPSQRMLETAWPLRTIVNKGVTYYIDDANSRLFETPAADTWPLAVGEARGAVVRLAQSTHTFFDLLDAYLRETSSRLADVFMRFLVPGNEARGLDRNGFTSFLREVIGAKMHLRAPQIEYFWAMLDLNDDGFVSSQELLSVAKDCRTVDRDMRAQDRRPAHAILVEAQRAADTLGFAGLSTLWQRFDRTQGLLRLGYAEVMGVVRELRKQQASVKELRYVAAALHSLDSCESCDGRYTLHDFRVALRLYKAPVPLHASAAATKRVQATQPVKTTSQTIAVPGRSLWKLQEQRFEGKTYLFDPHTCFVYLPARSQAEPLKHVGTVATRGGRDVVNWHDGRSSGHSNEHGSDLMPMLDAYLKEHQVRLRDLFDTFDENRNGKLESDELARFFQLLIPSMSQLQVDYLAAVMDIDGDGSVTYDEMFRKIKECHSTNTALAAKSSLDLADVQKRIEEYLAANHITLKQLFDSHADKRTYEGSRARGVAPGPRISQRGLSKLLRSIFPGPAGERSAQLAHASVFRSLDENRDGDLSFDELERALRLVALKVDKLSGSQAQAHSTTSWLSRGDVSSGASTRDRRRGRVDARANAVASDRYALNLAPVVVSGVQYYVDRSSNKVYQLGERGVHSNGAPQGASDMPRFIGHYVGGPPAEINFADGDGNVREQRLGLFERLDEHLKTNRLRLREVFDQFDTNRDGSLDRYESEHFIRSFIPEVSASESDFLRIMLDPNGDNCITFDELLHVIRECKDMNYRMLSKDNPGLAELRFKLGMKMGPELDWFFQKYDRDGNGTLDGNEVMTMIHDGFPGITPMQQRAIYLSLLEEVDGNFDGLISIDELKQALGYLTVHLVPPKWTGERRASAVYAAPTGPMPGPAAARLSHDGGYGARVSFEQPAPSARFPEWVLDPIVVENEVLWRRSTKQSDRVYRFSPSAFRPAATVAVRASASATTRGYGAKDLGLSSPDDDDLLCVGTLLDASAHAAAARGEKKHMRAPYVQMPGDPHPHPPRATFLPSSIRGKLMGHGTPCIRYDGGDRGDVLTRLGDELRHSRTMLEHALERLQREGSRRDAAPERMLGEALVDAIPTVSLTANQLKYVHAMVCVAASASSPQDIVEEVAEVCAEFGKAGWQRVAVHRSLDSVLSRVSAALGRGEHVHSSLRAAFDAVAGHAKHVGYAGFLDVVNRTGISALSRDEAQSLLTRLYRLVDDDEEGMATFSECARTLRLATLSCRVEPARATDPLAIKKLAEPVPMDLAAKELMHLKKLGSAMPAPQDTALAVKDNRYGESSYVSEMDAHRVHEGATSSTDFGRLALCARAVGRRLGGREHGPRFWDAAARFVGSDQNVRRAVRAAMGGAMRALEERGGRRSGRSRSRGRRGSRDYESYSDDEFDATRRRRDAPARALLVRRPGRERNARGEFTLDLMELAGGESYSSYSDDDELLAPRRRRRGRRGRVDYEDSYDGDYTYDDENEDDDLLSHSERFDDGTMRAAERALALHDDLGAQSSSYGARRIGGGYGVPVITQKRARGSRLTGGQLRRLGSILDASDMSTHLVDDVSGKDIQRARRGRGARPHRVDPPLAASTFGARRGGDRGGVPARAAPRGGYGSEAWQHRPAAVTSTLASRAAPGGTSEGWLRRSLEARGHSAKPHQTGYATSAPMIYGTSARRQAADAFEAFHVMADAPAAPPKAHGGATPSYGPSPSSYAQTYASHKTRPFYGATDLPSSSGVPVSSGVSPPSGGGVHSGYALAYPRMGAPL